MLVESQINTELLARGKGVKENLFRHCINSNILTNNENELIDVRHQGRVLSLVRGELDRFNRASGADETLLGR